MKITIKKLLTALALAAVCGNLSAVFDPVNDDTDLFRNNPNIPSERPNVLIVLDNTANWNSAFANEKIAFASVVGALDDSFNLGWVMYPETGGGNDTIDGAYVRFGMRQMTTTNKNALVSIINSFDILNDKGNNSTLSLAMHESYLYFAGKASRASYGKVKTDYTGNTAGGLPAAIGNWALPTNTAAALYNSATLGVSCAKNYIIYISNGPANENNSALATAQGLLSNISGLAGAAPATISITPNGMQNNWADEYAKFMAGNDVNTNLSGTQFVTTYTVEIDPATNNQDLAMTALMKSMAANGNGKYFAVTSGSSGSAIVAALNSIFSEIQAVNSVFAASTLPVSVNVRGTNLNQLYIGVFRPDSNDLPRWLGNLKAYQLKKDPNTGLVFTVDALENAAINSTTGFITASAKSFWTSDTTIPTNYWSFRTAAQNGIGGNSDAPDGDLVEKGGAGQQVRSLYFANGVNSTTPGPYRPIYSCTQGPNFPVCAPGSSLSATPFDTTNTDITPSALQLNTHLVTPLTAASVKNVSELKDRRDAAINSLYYGDGIVDVATGVATFSGIALNNTVPFTISSISNGAVATTITSISVPNGSNKVATATLAGTATLSVNQWVVISGNSNATLNGLVQVKSTGTSSGNTTFTYGSFTGALSGTGGSVTTSNTTVNATTSTNHTFAVGGTVTIAGVTPSNFNGDKVITAVTANSFAWANEAISVAPTGTTMTATGRGTTVTATVSSNHGFVAGQNVTISGATPAGYNGTFTIVSVPSTTTFTYVTSTAQTSAATGTIVASGTGSAATVTIAPWWSGSQVNLLAYYTVGSQFRMEGALPNGYNGIFTITSVVANADAYSITVGINLPAGLGTRTSGNWGHRALPLFVGGTASCFVVYMPNHGYVAGQDVTYSGATNAIYNTSFNITWAGTVNDYYHCPGGSFNNAGGSPMSRLTNNPLAYATITGHGLVSPTTVIVAGATPTGYNGTYDSTRVAIVDANTISYQLGSAPGTNTSTNVTLATATTRAKATSTSHGFTVGQTVTIAGASPNGFNGNYEVKAITADTFEYDLGGAEFTATGTITAVSGTGDTSQGALIVNWIRGQDNYQDENGNSSFEDTRSTIHGDVLHSRPAVVNYNRFFDTDPTNADNDVFIFYGGNDGVFRAVKGGFGSTTGQPSPGSEVWGFVAPEFFPNLARLRLNSPGISSNFKRPYFFDGPIGTYTLDSNNDGKLLSADGDKVWIYMGMRRGGRFMYSLDVSDPAVPKLLWRKGCPSLDPLLNGACDTGWEELGQTWSQPVVIPSINATSDPVIMFGAGYDSLVEDIDPSTITSVSAASVVATSGTFNRSMGRGIYVVNGRTGEIVWQAVGAARNPALPAVTHTVKVVSGMDHSISADIAVVVGDPTPKPFRAYVGDNGGNVWRIDFGDADTTKWTVVKLASIANTADKTGLRKFQFAPDAVGGSGFDAIIMGTGDREHPFDTTVINRVYMFKDKIGANTTPPVDSGGVQLQPTITEGTGTGTPMLNVTSNCIQVPANCTGTAPEAPGSGFTASQNTSAALNASTNMGWYISLQAGEKQIGGTLASGAGAVQFATNQPSASAGGGACSPNLGVARQYVVNFDNGTAFTGSQTFTTYAGGGFLPSPVLVYVGLGGASGTGSSGGGGGTGVPLGGTITGSQLAVGAGSATGGGNDPTGVVCFGASCALAPGVQLYSRLRKFWYKEYD